MSADTPASTNDDLDPEAVADLQARIDALETEVSDLRTDVDDDGPQKMVIIATKGLARYGVPAAHPREHRGRLRLRRHHLPHVLGSRILHEENSKNLQLSSVGNPNMPVPNMIAALPGMDRMTTRMMRNKTTTTSRRWRSSSRPRSRAASNCRRVR